MLNILKTPERKRFLIAVACVFIVAVCVVSKAEFQGAWVAIYSLMFTIVGSLPFGFYFLGPKDDSE